ncbi:phosphoglucosamine mutase [Halobacteriovorax sp. HLS]|uniref:phosphoglucosamine mutase n=1 Tax=Halobacteriovorax sp. HLS TaxID=2234000 RepID=UPI000FD92A64|nr:phosphoglucosamine mutase [Halobacteriovorax sp. HLS]
MSERKLFGTDGIRGKANIYPMTPEVATALGRAVTHYFQGHTKRKKPLIIVGKDTRLSCYMFEQAFAAGVCSQGGEVILTGPLPTPGVAFVTDSMRADAGVMISASHNHYSDNGIKIFDSNGHKLPDEVELELEELVLNLQLMPVKVGGDLGNAKRLREVFGRYLVHVKSAISNSCKMDQMRVVLDCANGAGYRVAPMMFDELGVEVIPLGVKPNGQNINLNSGSLHPEQAAEYVKQYRADLGVCLDGDADRVVIIDEDGDVVDGDVLIGLFAKLLLDKGSLKKGDTVVGTVMSNLGLENYIKSIGLNFHRTKVGDRYIVEHMRDKNCILGGEPSGHVIFGEYATTGDGCLASLKTIEAMKFYDKKLKELTKEIKLFPHIVKNVTVREKKPLEEIPSIVSALAEIEKELGSKGRILLRYSGTEPLARVMVEGESLSTVNSICERLVDLVKRELGN